MTVRRITSSVISDIFDATGNVRVDRPARDVVRGDLGHGRGLSRHGVAANGGEHLPPPVAVHVVVDHQNRSVAEQTA